MQSGTHTLIMFLLLVTVSASALRGQTQIDLRSQSRNVDFSQAQSVRPFKTGSSLPPTCTAGEMFFKTSAPSGSNTYGCVSTNIWALQGTGTSGGGSGSAAPTDFTAELNTGTNTLTITCPASECNVQTGDTVTRYASLQATFGPQSGSYTAYVYFDGQGLRYGYPTGSTMSTCTGTCVSGISQFPSNVVPLYSVVVSAGALQNGTLRDFRTRLKAAKRVIQGSNIVIAETADSITWSTPATLRNQPPGAKPACSVSTRGLFWHTNSGAGVKDIVEVCAKDTGDGYAWRTIY